MQTATVLGLDDDGLLLAAGLAAAGLDVLGCDSRQPLVAALNSGTPPAAPRELRIMVGAALQRGGLRAVLWAGSPTQAESAALDFEADVLLVAVPVPRRHDKPDLSLVLNALQAACTVLKHGDLLVIASPLPPGACRQHVAPFVWEHAGLRHEEDYQLALLPDASSLAGDFVVGGTRPAASARAAELFQRCVGGRVLRCDAPTAELVGSARRRYRTLCRGLADELGTGARQLGVDSATVLRLANLAVDVRL